MSGPTLHFEYINRYGILKRDPWKTHDATDLNIARIAEDIVGNTVRRVEVTGRWLLWNGAYWVETDNVTPIFDKLADTVKYHISNIRKCVATEKHTFMQEFAGWRNTPNATHDEMQETLNGLLETEDQIYKKLSGVASRNQIITLMGSHLVVKSDQLDRNTDKIVFLNKYYDCATGEFANNDPDQLATICIRQEYREPDDESKAQVQEYLHGLGFDEETLEYIQRCFGYAATGRGTEKRFWWFRGETDTSKSTLIDIVAKCLDQYTASSMSDQWCANKNTSSGHTEELARLRGKRLVTADEFRKNARFNEALLKKCTSGTGDMSASRKGEKTIEFNITWAFFFSSNYDCLMAEDDTAMLNRLNTITFEKKIAPEIKDTQFVTKFLSKGQNRMAMLQWVMEGARKYCESGIGADPAHVRASREEFLEQQISIGEQLEEIIKVDPNATGKKALTLSAVLGALSQLQKTTRQNSSFSKKEVSNTITRVFKVELTKANGHSGFVGLSLKFNQSNKSQKFDPFIDWGYMPGDDEIVESN